LYTEEQDDAKTSGPGESLETLREGLKEQLDQLADNIVHMPADSRSVLLIPAHQFFNVLVYNFLWRFAVNRGKHLQNAVNPAVQAETASQDETLHEMYLHAQFMKIFVKYYIHPTYEETRVMVQKRSDFFFRHHQDTFASVPQGIFLRTCVQGEMQAATVPRYRTGGGRHEQEHVPSADHRVLQTGMRPEFAYTSAHRASAANFPPYVMPFTHEAEADYAPGDRYPSPEITQNVPPIVQPTMDSILHLVRIATSHVTLYLQMCTHPWIIEHLYPGMLPVPSAIEGRLSIRDILRELVYIINNNLCGRFQASLAPHAADMQCILATSALQEGDVQFLLAILDDFEVRIAGRFFVGIRSCS
jgi:hypothetical protein